MKRINSALFRWWLPALLTLGLLAPFLQAAVDVGELETLFRERKFSILLEKALNTLSAQEKRLTPAEAAALNYYVAVGYKNNNNSDMALEYLKKVEQQFPTSEYVKPTLVQLADLYKEDYFLQAGYLEKLFEKFPQTPEAVDAGMELARSYLKLKNYQKSIPVLETLINLWKMADAKPELNLLGMLAYSGINDFIEANDYLRIVETKIPDQVFKNPLHMFEAGKIAYYNQNFKKAIQYLTKLFNVYPNYGGMEEASIILAQAYERDNNVFMSSIYLIKVLEKDPVDRSKKYALMLNLGRNLAQMGEEDVSKIRKNYPLHADSKKLLNMVKENSPVFEHRRDATVLLGDQLMKTNDMESIIGNYYKFLLSKRDPVLEGYFRSYVDRYIAELDKTKNYEKVLQFWVTIRNRKSMLSENNLFEFGRILTDMGMYINAEEIFSHMRRYTLYSRLWPKVRRQLARLYFLSMADDRFLSILNELDYETEEDRSEIQYYAVQVYKRSKSPQSVEKYEELLNAVDLQPAGIKTMFQFRLLELKAGYLESIKRTPEALALYAGLAESALLTEADRARLMIRLADLRFSLGEMQNALDGYMQVEKYKLNMEWIIFRKITILRKMGRASEAKAEFDRLKALNPNSFWLRQAEKENVR